MADKVTSTKSGRQSEQQTARQERDEARNESNQKINDLLDQAKDAMVEAGMPPDQADAMLNSARPSGVHGVVGNYADLQRMGAIAQTGVMPTPPSEEDVETDDLKEAFVENAGDGDPPDIDQDRLAFAHRLPEVTPAQEAADERHAKEATATDAGTTPKASAETTQTSESAQKAESK